MSQISLERISNADACSAAIANSDEEMFCVYPQPTTAIQGN